jgi:plasmid maintenance system killer protein
LRKLEGRQMKLRETKRKIGRDLRKKLLKRIQMAKKKPNEMNNSKTNSTIKS